MKAKLTVKKALEECVKIWEELAESGSPEKPEVAWQYENACPCCEYVCRSILFEREEGMSCSTMKCPSFDLMLFNRAINKCPLKSFWPNGCCDTSSPYYEWDKTSSRERRKDCAKQIANAAAAALKKLSA